MEKDHNSTSNDLIALHSPLAQLASKNFILGQIIILKDSFLFQKAYIFAIEIFSFYSFVRNRK